MIFILVWASRANLITLHTGLAFMTSSVPYSSTATSITLTANYPASTPATQTPIVALTISQYSVFTVAHVNFKVQASAIGASSLDLVLTYSAATTFLRGFCYVSSLLIYSSVLPDFIAKQQEESFAATGTAPTDLTVPLSSSNTYTGKQIILSLIGWDADSVDSAHYKIVLSLVSPSSVKMTTSQVTRRINFNYLIFDPALYTSTNIQLLGQGQILDSPTSYLTSTVQTTLTIPKITGPESLLLYVGVAGLDYQQVSPLVPLNVNIFNYDTTTVSLILTPSGNYKYINATIVLFNIVDCDDGTYFTSYTYECLAICPARSMTWSNRDCRCKNSLFVYVNAYKNCSCLAGSNYSQAQQNCLPLLTTTLRRSLNSLTLTFSVPQPAPTLNNSLFKVTQQSSTQYVITAPAGMVEGWLGITLSAGYYYLWQVDDWIPVQASEGFIGYRWLNYYGDGVAYPHGIRYAGPLLAVGLPGLQYSAMALQYSVNYPYHAYLLLSLFPRLFYPIGDWQLPFSNATRVLLDSHRYGDNESLLRDGAMCLSVIAIGWILFGVAMLIHSKTASHMVYRLYQACALLLFQANQAFSFVLLGMTIQTIMVHDFSSLESRAAFGVGIVYLVQLVALFVYSFCKLHSHGLKDVADLLFFAGHCRYEEGGMGRPVWWAWFSWGFEVAAFTAFWVFSSNWVVQVSVAGSATLLSFLLLVFYNPFHHRIFTALKVTSQVLLLLQTGLLVFFQLYYTPLIDSPLTATQQETLLATGYTFGVVVMVYLLVGLCWIAAGLWYLCRQGRTDIEEAACPYLQKEETEFELVASRDRNKDMDSTSNKLRDHAREYVKVFEVERNQVYAVSSKEIKLKNLARPTVKKSMHSERFNSLEGIPKQHSIDNKDPRNAVFRKLFKEMQTESFQTVTTISIDFKEYAYGQELYSKAFDMRHEIRYREGQEVRRFEPEGEQRAWLPFSPDLASYQHS